MEIQIAAALPYWMNIALTSVLAVGLACLLTVLYNDMIRGLELREKDQQLFQHPRNKKQPWYIRPRRKNRKNPLLPTGKNRGK